MKLSKKQEQAFCKAMTETLWAYERLIANPIVNTKYWHKYGHYGFCRVCKSIGFRPDFTNVYHCEICPLMQCQEKTYSDFNDAIWAIFSAHNTNYNEIKRTAENRYKWLIKKLEKEGFEYK